MLDLKKLKLRNWNQLIRIPEYQNMGRVVVSEKEDVSRSSKRPSFNSSADSVEFVLQRELLGQISPPNCTVSLY